MIFGGFYLNHPRSSKNWLLCHAYPSVAQFSSFFQFKVDYHYILETISSRHSITVPSHRNGFTLIATPVFSHVDILAILIFGTAQSPTEIIAYLEQIRDSIATSLSAYSDTSSILLKNIEELRAENERLKKEEELNKAMLVSVFGMLSDTVVVCTDVKGTILYASKAVEEFFGYTSEDLVGAATPLIFHDKNDVSIQKREYERTHGKTVDDFDMFIQNAKLNPTRECKYVKKDGSRVQLLLTIRSVKNQNSQIIGYIGVAQPPRKSSLITSNYK